MGNCSGTSSKSRGLPDAYHQQSYSNHQNTDVVTLAPTPPVVPAATYEPSPAYPYEPPHQVESELKGEVKLFAGGNENKKGEQQIGDVEVGNRSNETTVSPLFSGATIDIKVGSNVNEGQKQSIGSVKIGNVGLSKPEN